MKLLLGDSNIKLKELEDNSIDTIITDPPYGLSFMGKKWDYDVPSTELWKECLRVLKPGGTALIFAGSRTQHRMAVNVEDAGFILKDTMMWLYGSGFPKATDISKQLDKGVERKVVGKNPNSRPNHEGQQKDTMGGKMQYSPITEAATTEAKLWNGWKSHGLKPAYEPILVAMKPNDGTYAANALKHGVSGLNIDGGRIGYKSDEDLKQQKNNFKGHGEQNHSAKSTFTAVDNHDTNLVNTTGRFPANILLDESAAALLDEQSGELKSAGEYKKSLEKPQWDNHLFTQTLGAGRRHNDYANEVGGASRFFYVAKASKAERNAGCEGLPKIHSSNTEDSPNPMRDERPDIKTANHHPTVKPIKLMEYLCTLTKTPTGGTILDPFMGSGTTGVAAVNTERDFIGIEMSEEYMEICKARIEHAEKNIQPKLF